MRHSLLALALAASAWAPSAHAAASSTASLTGIRFELIDLTPDDDEKPWFRLAGGLQTGVTASIHTPLLVGADSRYLSDHADGWLMPLSLGLENSTAHALGEASADGLYASGHTDGTLARPEVFDWRHRASYGGGASSYGTDFSSLQLSPGARLVVSAWAAGSASTTIGYLSTGQNEVAGSWMRLYFSGGGVIADELKLEASFAFQAGSFSGQDLAASRLLSIQIDNDGKTVKSGLVGANANVYGSSLVTAVPEPGSWALMLSGLAVVGGLARRRVAKRR